MMRTSSTPSAPPSRRWTAPLLVAAALAATTTLAQPAADRELLNSERIARRFGSYGIEVLEHGESVRVSNLFSGEGDERVTRTFAVVVYPESVDPAYAAEHEIIVGGGSIGAVFTRRGWSVVKRHRFLGELGSTRRLERMMGGIAPQPLATHVYVLDVVKPGVDLEYATIVEIHHPDYLTLRELGSIYGETYEPPTRLGELAALVDVLELARERAVAE